MRQRMIMKKITLLSLIFFVFINECREQQPILYLFAHGLANTQAQASNYENVLFESAKNNIVSFNFPDATKQFWRVNITEANLGQKPDLDKLSEYYYKKLEHNPQTHFIGIGVSRGAATWLNFMGIDGHDNIKALILESPFDSIANTVDPIIHAIIPLIFQKYNIYGIQPKDSITQIPKNLPILIVAIKDDHLVPYTSTLNAYRMLKESGHKNVHILAFESGKHGKFVKDPHIRDVYRNVAHAFYKKYGFPYNKEYAKAGKKQFKMTQP